MRPALPSGPVPNPIIPGLAMRESGLTAMRGENAMTLTPGFRAERDACVGHVPMAADVRSKCGWWEPESRLTAW